MHEVRSDSNKFDVEYLAEQRKWRCRRLLAQKMLSMGFDPDYRVSYAILLAGPFVLTQIPGLNSRDEFIWLCNKITNRFGKRGCSKWRDNRLSYDHHGKPGASYIDAQTYAQGHSYDCVITNPKTGTSYWLGHNE